MKTSNNGVPSPRSSTRRRRFDRRHRRSPRTQRRSGLTGEGNTARAGWGTALLSTDCGNWKNVGLSPEGHRPHRRSSDQSRHGLGRRARQPGQSPGTWLSTDRRRQDLEGAAPVAGPFADRVGARRSSGSLGPKIPILSLRGKPALDVHVRSAATEERPGEFSSLSTGTT